MYRLAPIALLGLSACSYTSAYIPPEDGRARLLWAGKQVIADIPVISSECSHRVDVDSALPATPREALVGQAWWQPGPDDYDDDPGGGPSGGASVYVIVTGPGGGPRPGEHARGGARGGFHATGGRGGATAGRFPAGHAGGAGHGGGGGGGGGAHGDWGKGAIAIVILAYAIIPTVVVVWATQRPEETNVAKGIDKVHAFSDLDRSGDPACAGPLR